MPLFLIRHGETALNVARTLQPAATPLSPRGLAQAESLAQRLAAMPVKAILSSDLPRARQTAEAIARATGLAVRTTALLQERNFGDLRGQPYDGLGFDPLAMADAPPGGESMDAFARRVRAAFDAALAMQIEFGGALAVVSHGLVIHHMLATFARPGAGLVLPASMANTSVSIVAETPPHALELLNSTSHLEPAVRDDPRHLSGG